MQIVCYTHSDYSDLWDIYTKNIIKYGKNKFRLTFLSNKQVIIGSDILEWDTFIYNEKLSYSERWIQFLESNNCENIFKKLIKT